MVNIVKINFKPNVSLVLNIFSEITKYFLEEKKKDYLGENPILELTDDNYDSIVSSAETIMVNFYINE